MPWQSDGLRKSVKVNKRDISKPTNFVHRIHADFDPETGDLRGLPSQWETILGSDFMTLRRKSLPKRHKEFRIPGFQPQNGTNVLLQHHSSSIKLQDDEFRSLLASLVNARFDPRTHFAQFTEIGSGSSGRVFRAISTYHGGTVAVKCMNISEQKRRYLLLNEILIPRELNHQNLIRFIDSFLIGNQLWVVSEFAEMGPLTRIVTQKRMAEPLIATVTQQILSALVFLHERRIVHRDVKSDSILITANGTVKLSDFGFCVHLTEQIPYRRSLLGTPYWLSAQVAAREPYGTDADVWSLGITIFEMVFGEPPYFDLSPAVAVQKIISEPPPQFPPYANVSPGLASFCSAMLQKDPSLRASARQLLKHSFLRTALPPPAILPLFKDLKG